MVVVYTFKHLRKSFSAKEHHGEIETVVFLIRISLALVVVVVFGIVLGCTSS